MPARRPSPPLVVATIALFMSVTGLGWAALDRSSVKSKQIKDGQVKTQDVADDTNKGALTGDDISNAGGGTLGADDLATDAVGAAELAPDSAAASELAPGSVRSSELAANSVGSATVVANSLTGADVNEATLQGTPVRFRRAMPDTSLAVPILDLGGIRLEAGCSAAEDLTLFATSAVDNAVFQLSAVDGTEAPATVAEPDFEQSQTLNLHTALAAGNSIAAGTFTYTRTNGTVVSGTLLFGQGSSFDDGAADCIVAGHAWRLP